VNFEQIAVQDNEKFNLMSMLRSIGHSEWTRDKVIAEGVVSSPDGGFVVCQNTAILQFNYSLFPGKEFELIHYTDGPNFLGFKLSGGLSHFGVHVESIDVVREFMARRGFYLAQEVITKTHESPLVTRRYHYAIYSHKNSNFCWKLIERIDPKNAQTELNKLLEYYL